MFNIMGQNKEGIIELIDDAETVNEAEHLTYSYSVEFGMGWAIWWVTK